MFTRLSNHNKIIIDSRFNEHFSKTFSYYYDMDLDWMRDGKVERQSNAAN